MRIPFLSFLTKSRRPIEPTGYESVKPSTTHPRLKTLPSDAATKAPEWTHKQLVEVCRTAADNYGVAKEIVTAMQIYAIGDGLRAQPRTENAAWNERAREIWRRFERRADISGKFNLRQLCMFVSRALDTDGEIFFVKTKFAGTPRLQVLETHRLSYKNDASRRIVDGIKWSETGAPIAYFFINDGAEETEIPASDVIRVGNFQRPSETRCIPNLQHAYSNLSDAAYLLKMEKRNAAAQANFAYALTTPNPETAEEDMDAFHAATAGNATPAAGNATPDDGNAERVSEVSKLDGGKMLKIPEGMKLDVLESKRPSQTFLGFHEALMRDSTLGVSSYEIAVDSSKIGGASVRLQTAKMERRISARQQDIIEQFLVPAWRYVIGVAIATEELPAQKEWTEVEFSTPRRLTVDAGRESAALLNEVREGTRPLEDLFDAMGYGDWEEETRRRAQLIAKTREIAKEFGVPAESLAPLLFAGTKGAGA